MLLLTAAASLGCWLSYIQGRWLGNTRIVQNWLSHLPSHYHQRAHHLFHKHGLSALLIGRFIAFVRTLLPTIAGFPALITLRFQFFNWMSGLLWVLILTSLGYLLGKTPVFLKYEDQLMSCLMLLPVALLVFGLIGSLVVLWKKKNTEAGANDGHETPFPAPVQLAAGWFSSARRPVLALAGGAAAGRPRWRYARLARVSDAGRFLRLASSMPTASRFKSITPQKDGLLIKFDSTARARRRKKFSAALCHMVILLPCWRTITRPPPGYPACATRRIASG